MRGGTFGFHNEKDIIDIAQISSRQRRNCENKKYIGHVICVDQSEAGIFCVDQSEASIFCVDQSEASIICVDQSEASIQVTWFVLTNQRPVFGDQQLRLRSETNDSVPLSTRVTIKTGHLVNLVNLLNLVKVFSESID